MKILTHPDESDSEIKKAREEAGLKYAGSILLEGKTPRENCFYDGSLLEKLFDLSGEREQKACEKCGINYQVPKEQLYRNNFKMGNIELVVGQSYQMEPNTWGLPHEKSYVME